MHSLLKVLGSLLLIPGGLLVLMIPFAAFDTEHQGAAIGLLMLAGMFGVPGGLLFRNGLLGQRRTATQEQMVGFVRSHDAFSLDELAAHIGKTPAQAQTLLNADIAKHQLPLVMHRPSGRYLRLDRLSNTAQVAERCQSCGGSLGNQIVFEGEQLTCPYCNATVHTHAPVQAQASWQQAQGAWGQQAWPQAQPGYPAPQAHPGYAPPQQQQQYAHQQQQYPQAPVQHQPGHHQPGNHQPGNWGRPPGQAPNQGSWGQQ